MDKKEKINEIVNKVKEMVSNDKNEVLCTLNDISDIFVVKFDSNGEKYIDLTLLDDEANNIESSCINLNVLDEELYSCVEYLVNCFVDAGGVL